jgi:PAS domain S-box-containing protein
MLLEKIMLAKSLFPTRPFHLSWWPTVAAVLLLIHAALSVTVRQSRALTAYTLITYFLVLVLAAGIATLNAVQSREAIRLFWSFLAMAFGVWSLSACSWIYYKLVLGRDRPTSSVGLGVPLVLHILFMIAAVASRPHLKLSPHRGYRATLNFLLLLCFWVFAYAFLWVPHSYTDWNVAFALRGQALYIVENFLLLVVLGLLIVRAQLPWKSIYRHLLGASALYILGSSIANYLLAYRGVYLGLKDIPYMAAACWFVWVALQGRKLAPQLAQSAQLEAGDTKYTSLLAMLSVLAVPAVGVWELLLADEPYRTRVIRLLIVLLSVLLLSVFVFVNDYLTNRELSSDIGLANERLRLAMQSGKSVGWEWDIASGRDLWFGDLQTLFGIRSDTYCAQVQEFYDYVHPEDRPGVSQAVADARDKQKAYTGEFRVLRPDGTVRRVAARGKFYYAKNGEPERMLGMAVDITDLRRMEEERRELSGMLIIAQEAERSRLARELHDDFNQRLAVLAIDLEKAAESIPDCSAETSQRLHQLWARTSEIGADLHDLSHQLHSSTLESLGLVLGVSSFCREFAEQQGIQVDFAHGDAPRVPRDVALCLFRIVQEGLRNVKRHSEATRAEVRLEAVDDSLHLSVSDTGKGFESKKSWAKAGLGIRSMEERLRLVGGNLEVQSRLGEGTRIDAWVPLKSASKQAS